MNLDDAPSLGSFAGGCDYCDAETHLLQPTPRVSVLEVRHDDACPDYRARLDRGAAS